MCFGKDTCHQNMKENRHTIKKYTFALYIGAMLFCMCTNLTGSVLSDIMMDYEINLDHGGFMTFFQYSGGVAAILLMAVLADRFQKPVMLITAFLMTAVMLASISGFVPVTLFMVLYLLLGAALGVIDVLNNAVLSDLYQENRNKMLSILHGVCGMGASVIPIITAIAGTANWKDSYRAVAGVVCALVLLQMILYLWEKASVDTVSSERKRASGTTSIKEFFSDRKIWIAIFSMLFFGACQGGVLVWIVKYCKDVFSGVSALQGALGLSAYWLGATVCRLMMAAVLSFQRWNSRTVIIRGGILAGIALFLGIISGNYYGMLAGVFAFGMLNGATLPRIVGIMTGWYPDKSGLTSSISFVALYVGLATAPLLMGVVASAYGMGPMMLLPVAATVLSGVMGIALPKEKD